MHAVNVHLPSDVPAQGMAAVEAEVEVAVAAGEKVGAVRVGHLRPLS